MAKFNSQVTDAESARYWLDENGVIFCDGHPLGSPKLGEAKANPNSARFDREAIEAHMVAEERGGAQFSEEAVRGGIALAERFLDLRARLGGRS